MSVESSGDALTLFERNVKQTLRLYDQPERLGQESPLASPYMLARRLRDRPRPVTAADRGALLQAAIRAAAARLWGAEAPPASHDAMLAAIAEVRRAPDDPRYAYLVLELRCFQQQIRPNRISDIWEDERLLLGSKSQHYRDFDAAVRRLAPLLLDELRPTLRPERPRPPAVIYGYERQVTALAAALSGTQPVALIGPGGIGKTSLAATALDRLADRPSFWYTLRPGFNDGLGSLLFALGAFLHELGASNTWQYLVTANGVANDLNLAAGLLREDLARLEGRPILCFDDLEHLGGHGLDLQAPAGDPLLDLIEALRGTTPLLLISQRSIPSGDRHIDLAGLDPESIGRLWRDAGFPLDGERARRLHAFTGGNPRLLTLLLALQREGDDPLAESAIEEPVRSLLPAFERLWRRLRPTERQALQALAVYQGYAPEDVLPEDGLAALSRLRLVERDEQGGVAMLPALALAIRAELPPERAGALHMAAAVARLERGEYTAAAYHFAQAGDARRAVQTWFPHRQHALARGEADAARPIFLGIDRAQLDRAERKALDLIRAELRQYAGQLADGLTELEQGGWQDASESSARLWMLRGELEDALGFPERAITSYDEGIRVTARLVAQLTALHQRRALLSLRRRDFAASWQDVTRAECELALMRGALLDETGEYDASIDASRQARDLAAQLADDRLLARAERWLATIYGRREQLAEAVAHATRAIAIYERLGDRLNQEQIRSNLASIYVQTRQFQLALAVGAPSYAFFQAVRDPYYAAVTAANLAEASFYLDDLDAATRYASEVIALDQPFPMPYARFTLGQVDLARGQIVSAATHFSAAIEQARRNEDQYLAVFAQRALGEVYLRAGDRPAARAQLEAALAAFRRFDIPSEAAATEALLARLDAAEDAVRA